METYSRIGLLKRYGNLQSYWTIEMPTKLTVVLGLRLKLLETIRDLCLSNLEKVITKSTQERATQNKILQRNLQSYWTTTNLRKLTVVLGTYKFKETYIRIRLI
jgi:hypothetical protein